MRVRCPYCREKIRKDASICPYCQQRIEPVQGSRFSFVTTFLMLGAMASAGIAAGLLWGYYSEKRLWQDEV